MRSLPSKRSEGKGEREREKEGERERARKKGRRRGSELKKGLHLRAGEGPALQMA